MKKGFYITTTLPYINAEPHIGFAREIIEADVLARFHRLNGDEVFFNTGTDEHGLKVYQKSQELGIEIQKYCNEEAKKFMELKQILNLTLDKFTRTTDPEHISAVQEFWKRCASNGDIYKKNYKVKYCVGCELEKTDSELVDGKCPLHPNKDIECFEEENYFFSFSKYQEALLKIYKDNPDFVLPKKRLNEVKAFVERGLEDFSISRLKEKMPWGIEVPGDSEHVIYVWFDALVNYISAIDWPKNNDNFEKWWPAVQIAGKDNVRQQAAMWQAMLVSAKLPPSKQIFINGFITSKGQKMSKSLGNVITVDEMVEKFGTDGTRYLLLSIGGFFGEDVDVAWDQLVEKYNADLANGIGNLVSRIAKLSKGLNFEFTELEIGHALLDNDEQTVDVYLKKFDIARALLILSLNVKENNKYIEDNKPWELAKNNKVKFLEVMKKINLDLFALAKIILPFMPDTSEGIKKALETKEPIILFPRIK